MSTPSEFDTTGCLNNCIETQSGVIFDIITPAGPVRIEDIAHGLAHVCRFGGQCSRHYSVAEHSVLVHDLIAAEYGRGADALAGLLHDAEEAYLGDMVRPLKQHHPDFIELGHRLQAFIRSELGVEWSDERASLIKVFDNIALRIEAEQLMPSRGRDWNWRETPLSDRSIHCYPPETAKAVFLQTYESYGRARLAARSIVITHVNSFRGVNESCPWYVCCGKEVLSKFQLEQDAKDYRDLKLAIGEVES